MRAAATAVCAAAGVLSWPVREAWARVPGQEASVDARTRHSGDAETECLVVLDSMVVLLQAGTPQGQAVSLATRPLRSAPTDTAAGWRELESVTRADGDVAEAWGRLGRQWGCPTFADVAAAWEMSTRYGCPLATALEAAANGLRAARRQRGAIEGAIAGAHATMAVLTALPLLGVSLGLLLGVDMFDVYLGRTGLVTLWPGVLLLWCGRRWASRLVHRALASSEPARTATNS